MSKERDQDLIKSRVSQHYDTYPFPGKLNAYGPWTELAPNLLTSLGLMPDALRGARVLDAGCGTGEYARSFAQLGAQVTAIDLSREALTKARSIDEELGLPDVEYLQADLLNLPSLGTFDFIFSLGVLHHTANPLRGFHNLVTKLRPGGYLTVGLYSSISRFHILVMRQILNLISLKNQECAIDLAQHWFRPFLHLFIGAENVDDRARIADLLANVHEHPISLGTVLRWFKADGFHIVGCAPSCDVADYPLLARLSPQPDSRLTYFAIQLRWLLWNADYYIVTGRASSW